MKTFKAYNSLHPKHNGNIRVTLMAIALIALIIYPFLNY